MVAVGENRRNSCLLGLEVHPGAEPAGTCPDSVGMSQDGGYKEGEHNPLLNNVLFPGSSRMPCTALGVWEQPLPGDAQQNTVPLIKDPVPPLMKCWLPQV